MKYYNEEGRFREKIIAKSGSVVFVYGAVLVVRDDMAQDAPYV